MNESSGAAGIQAFISLECTAETFSPAPDRRVRWLDRRGDTTLAREAWEAAGVPMARADWTEWRRQGFRFCGIVEDDRLVATAAAWMCSPRAWELAGVRTRETHRRRLYAKVVCSFVTAYILANVGRATCSTRADNAPMLRVAVSLGYRPSSDT